MRIARKQHGFGALFKNFQPGSVFQPENSSDYYMKMEPISDGYNDEYTLIYNAVNLDTGAVTTYDDNDKVFCVSCELTVH